MEWYWWIVIAAAAVIVLLLIYFFGSAKLKKLAYELVCNAEKLIGNGSGQEKYELVLTNLSKLTKGLIPVPLLKKMIEWAVERMKEMLLEDKKSFIKKSSDSK